MAAQGFWLATGQIAGFSTGRCRVPGDQAISRAELCAVIAACRHAARLGRLTPQYRLTVSLWLGNGADYPDLTGHLLAAWRRNVQVCKVKAHVDLAVVPPELWWPAAANARADIEAKAAVANDWQFMRDITDEIGDNMRCQADGLRLFFRFVAAISSEENCLKKAGPGNPAVTQFARGEDAECPEPMACAPTGATSAFHYAAVP